ncbi:MAG TPA: HlyD family efflux transporter periplasmic adaptor subunit [Paracoccaceae bacterium]|nr:HlyD family efflux transporter periplasmic adaptor subunit [Paracoccaceae bacterium]
MENPERPGRVIRLIGVAFAVFLIWAALAPVDEIVRAEGQAVSTARPQIIQNLEGGILAELMVAEGQTVEAGAPLARLHATQYESTVDDLRDQIATLELRRLRLEAEMTGQDVFEPPEDLATRLPAIAASESALLAARLADAAARIEGARQVARQADRERELLEAMLKQEVVPLIEVTRARKAAADAQNRLNDAVAQTELERAQAHADTLKELGTLRQTLRAAEDQLGRTVLTAPMRGVVNRLTVTTIGGVVRPGEEILQVAPLGDALMIEARVRPQDIAAVRPGQAATVKLTAYDYTIWGTLEAEVVFVSEDIFRDERSRLPDGDPHYRVTLRVDPESLTGRRQGLDIRPGMQAVVELRTGAKTVLSYLTKPLWKAQEAMRER